MSKCNKNGIKREGESCTLNNNCIYPNCKIPTVNKLISMEDQLIEFKTAKLAKEKGFIPQTDTTQITNNYFLFGKKLLKSEIDEKTSLLLLLSMCEIQKWLREVHNIVVESIIFDKGFLEKDKFCYQYRVYNNSNDWFTGLEFKTYESALEEGLQIALNLIK